MYHNSHKSSGFRPRISAASFRLSMILISIICYGTGVSGNCQMDSNGLIKTAVPNVEKLMTEPL